MENNSNYKAIQAIIAKLDQQLKNIVELQLQQDFSLMRREIEEHFERAIHALRARQHMLIEQLNLISHKQDSVFEEIKGTLKDRINVCNDIAQAGAHSFKHSVASADLVWQEALKFESTPIDTPTWRVQVTIDLPTELLENIDNHGKVECSVELSQLLNSEEQRVPLPISVEGSRVDYLPVENDGKTLKLVGSSSILAGSIQGYADDSGESAKFSLPLGICYNPNDEFLYVCDYFNNAIRKISLTGSVTTLLIDKDIFFKKFKLPRRIAYCQNLNTFYVTTNDHKIFAVSSTGNEKLLAGNKDGYRDGVGKEASFSYPNGIAINQRSGLLYVAENGNNKIRIVTPKGEVSTLAGKTPGMKDGSSTKAKFDTPLGICFDEKSQSLLVCDYKNNKIRRVTLDGQVSTVCDVQAPKDITIANDVILTVSDQYLCKIHVKGGKYTATKLAHFTDASPWGITVHEPSCSIFVTDSRFHTIQKLPYSVI